MTASDDWAARLFGEPSEPDPEPTVNDLFRESLLAASEPPNPFDLRNRQTVNPYR